MRTCVHARTHFTVKADHQSVKNRQRLGLLLSPRLRSRSSRELRCVAHQVPLTATAELGREQDSVGQTFQRSNKREEVGKQGGACAWVGPAAFGVVVVVVVAGLRWVRGWDAEPQVGWAGQRRWTFPRRTRRWSGRRGGVACWEALGNGGTVRAGAPRESCTIVGNFEKGKRRNVGSNEHGRIIVLFRVRGREEEQA